MRFSEKKDRAKRKSVKNSKKVNRKYNLKKLHLEFCTSQLYVIQHVFARKNAKISYKKNCQHCYRINNL